MARYKVLELSWIDNVLVHPGVIINYAGIASANLELVEEKVTKDYPAIKPKTLTKQRGRPRKNKAI